MREQALSKEKNDYPKRHAWQEGVIQFTEIVRYANGWQRNVNLLPRYIELNNICYRGLKVNKRH